MLIFPLVDLSIFARRSVIRQSRSSIQVCCWLVLICAAATAGVASAADIHRELEDIAKRLTTRIEETGRTKIAVADFTDLNGNVSQLGRFISEEVSTNMVVSARGFSVIDRNHLRTILKEQKLSMSGLMDPENQKKLGKILGVDALVLGSITPFGESYRVTFKVVATDTAQVITADRGMVPKTPATDELWAALVPDGLQVGASQSSIPPQVGQTLRPRVPPQPAKGEYRNQYLSLVIESISMRGDKKNLNLVGRLTNVTQGNIYVMFGDIRVVDNAGVAWDQYDNSVVGIPTYSRNIDDFYKHAGSSSNYAPVPDRYLSLMTPGQSQPVSISLRPQGDPGDADVITLSVEVFMKVPDAASKDKWNYTHVGAGISGIKLQ